MADPAVSATITPFFTPSTPWCYWLEDNGYDVSYFTDVDASRFASLILNHQIYMDVGHDEYISGQQRSNIQAALAAGVNLAFFSGNEFYWKTYWASSLDSSATPTARWSVTRTRRTAKCSTRKTRRTGPAPGATRGSARRPTAANPRMR